MLRSLLSLFFILGANANGFLAPPDDAPEAAIVAFDETRLLEVSRIPQKAKVASQPIIQAKSALLMDVSTGLPLYEKNIYQPLPMASLTKIMTALLILESHNLDEVVNVEDDFSNYGEVGVKMWLQQHEKMTVENLLIGLLVRSAGDAAVTLAKFHSGSVEAFVDKMNQRAQLLRLTQTHFQNPIGLDHPDQYSTAFDLAILTRYALRNPDFRRMVELDRAIPSSVDGRIQHPIDSTNYLLNSYLDIRGVKTGTTDAAGASLINLAVHPNGDAEVISILLDSPERFQESKRLIDWSFRNFYW